MPEIVIARLSSADAPLDWVVLGEDGSCGEHGHGSIAELAGSAADRRIIALASSGSVLRLNAKIPLKGDAKIRQALPFALEEQIAGDIDDQHFAFSKKNSAGAVPVAIVDDQLMQSWHDDLAELNISAIYSESDGLLPQPATVSILINGDTATICDQTGEYTITDTESLQIILDMLLDQHIESMTTDATLVPLELIVYCDEHAHTALGSLWERLRIKTESVDIKLLQDGALAFLGGRILETPGVNLLQGQYAPKSEINIEWGPWKLPASLVGGVCLLVLLFQGAQFWQYSRQEAALDSAATQILAQTFPEAANATDPWAELTRRLGAADSNSPDYGPGFGGAIEVLAQAFSNSTALAMQTISYRDGIVDLQLQAPNVEALDKLRQEIASSGEFEATIQSANPDDDIIKGRMQITAVAK